MDFNKMVEVFESTIPRFKMVEDNLNENIFVLEPLKVTNDPMYIDENGNLESMGYGQGTGFFLRGIGLITNWHVVEDLIKEILDKGLNFCKKYYVEYYSENNGEQKAFKANIIYWYEQKDIAILEPEYPEVLENGLIPNTKITIGESIKVLGLPDHQKGSNIRPEYGEVRRSISTQYSNV